MPTFTNQATLFFNNGSTNSNIVTGEIIQVLSVQKSALGTDYTPGEDITYVVSLVNTGTTPYNNLTVTDDLGAYTFNGETRYPLSFEGDTVKYYVNGVEQPDPAFTSEPTLVITGINVPAGGNALFIYNTTPNDLAPIGGDAVIENTVTVTGSGLSEPITASATVTAASGTALSITKTLSSTSVPENGTLTYTFLIENRGSSPAVASDNLSVSDMFAPILSDITVTLNGNTLTPTVDYTYNQSTGLFTTIPGRITVPAATFTQNPVTGVWTVTPGTAILQVTGTI